MSVWLTIPSARPPEEAERCLKLWRERGYKIALWIDKPHKFPASCDLGTAAPSGGYPGYSVAVNWLIRKVTKEDPQAEWFIIGGDDVEPDPSHSAEEIAIDCRMRFYAQVGTREARLATETFGVMQPTGDRFAGGSIDKIAGSAWIGREFARRMYGGNGPLWPEYTRFFMDEELQLVAQKYGVFQQRPDLIHLHRHYMRESEDIKSNAVYTEIPAHLKAQEALWNPEKAIFQKRRAEGFPGSEPIA
jgi:hypothetical protein